MKWDEKTIPSTVNHTHMKGLGGERDLAKQFDERFFTFSELCIVLYICEKDQLDAQFFLLFYLNFIILYRFQTNNSSNHNVLATRHHICA